MTGEAADLRALLGRLFTDDLVTDAAVAAVARWADSRTVQTGPVLGKEARDAIRLGYEAYCEADGVVTDEMLVECVAQALEPHVAALVAEARAAGAAEAEPVIAALNEAEHYRPAARLEALAEKWEQG